MAKAPRKKTGSKASKKGVGIVLPAKADGGRIEGPAKAMTAPRAKQGWLGRLFGRSEKAKPAKIDAGQLAELRESVMQEYRARAAQEAGEAESKPFARPMLPEGAMGRAPRRGGDWLFTGFVVVSLLVIVLLLVQGGRKPEGPMGALAGLDKAIVRGDEAALARSVDVDAVSGDVVSQLFGSGVLPPAKGAGLVEPGLAATLAEEMRVAVVEGAVYGDGTSLLKQLWMEAGGDHLQLGKPRIITQNATSAVAEVLITRDDTGQVGEILQLEIAKQGPNWRVVALPNVGVVMAKLNAIAAALPDAEQLASLGSISPAAGKVAEVTGVHKSSGHVQSTMRLKVTYANKGSTPVEGLAVRVTIGDARGVPLRVIDLEDPATLAPGAIRTRTLNVPVDKKDNIQRAVAELPLSAFSVTSTARALN